MDIGEQERAIIVEPLEASDYVGPGVAPVKPEQALEQNPWKSRSSNGR